jgi:hypothetical protein
MATGNQVLPEAPVAHDEVRPQPKSRRGGGGRWLVWGLRGVVWVVLLLIGYRGVAAIVTGAPVIGGSAPASVASGFPVAMAQAYALEFGQVYLNFSPATAVTRGTELAGFLPPGADSQLGWNGAGTQTMQSEQVSGVAVRSAHNAIVTLLASVDGHLISLGIPIYAADGGLVVSGRPALLSPPPRATPPAPPAITEDLTTQAALSRQLPAFFRAFASGDGLTLGRFLVAGAQISGLDSAVTFGGISSITVPDSPGATRHIVVTVVWSTPSQTAASGKSSVGTTPAQLQMTYAMTVVRISGSWYVQAISAAATQPGSSS